MQDLPCGAVYQCLGLRFPAAGLCAVLAIGEPLTYHEMPNPERLVSQLFRHVSSLLPAGGLFIFDVIELGKPVLTGRSWYSGKDWAVLVQTTENQAERILLREIETFRRVGANYRRGREEHKVCLFDRQTLSGELSRSGFAVQTMTSYGEQPLPARRRAFVATRLPG
jgi:hypothetical protein